MRQVRCRTATRPAADRGDSGGVHGRILHALLHPSVEVPLPALVRARVDSVRHTFERSRRRSAMRVLLINEDARVGARKQMRRPSQKEGVKVGAHSVDACEQRIDD